MRLGLVLMETIHISSRLEMFQSSPVDAKYRLELSRLYQITIKSEVWETGDMLKEISMDREKNVLPGAG